MDVTRHDLQRPEGARSLGALMASGCGANACRKSWNSRGQRIEDTTTLSIDDPPHRHQM